MDDDEFVLDVTCTNIERIKDSLDPTISDIPANVFDEECPGCAAGGNANMACFPTDPTYADNGCPATLSGVTASAGE